MTIRILPASEKLLLSALRLNRMRVEAKVVKADELRFIVDSPVTAEELRKKIINYAGFFWMEIDS